MHRILVVDTDFKTRRELSRKLIGKYELFVFDGCLGVEETMARVQEVHFNHAIVGLRFDRGNGFDYAQSLKKRNPDVDITLVCDTMQDARKNCVRACYSGANSVLVRKYLIENPELVVR